MKLSRLLTYTFDQNVGPMDRIFRIVSGVGLAALPWLGNVATPEWASIALTVSGLAWAGTGILSRCGMYYLFGFSTKKA
ncbi:MAG: DUF2892 domain-containing protein [Pseudomonadota bacterium]